MRERIHHSVMGERMRSENGANNQALQVPHCSLHVAVVMVKGVLRAGVNYYRCPIVGCSIVHAAPRDEYEKESYATTKNCSKCGVRFHTRKQRGRYDEQSWCKDCRRSYLKSYKEKKKLENIAVSPVGKTID